MALPAPFAQNSKYPAAWFADLIHWMSPSWGSECEKYV